MATKGRESDQCRKRFSGVTHKVSCCEQTMLIALGDIEQRTNQKTTNFNYPVVASNTEDKIERL